MFLILTLAVVMASGRMTTGKGVSSGGRTWAGVVRDGGSGGHKPAGNAREWKLSDQEWPSLLNKPSGGKTLWADTFEEAEWDLDSQLLAQMEAREDEERSADASNLETFGPGACGWSYEQQAAANESLHVTVE